MANITTAKCGNCLGTGKITLDIGIPPETLMVDRDCSNCGGTGRAEVERDASDPKLDEILDALVICKRRLKKIMDKLEIGE